jgi:hypothetical protein
MKSQRRMPLKRNADAHILYARVMNALCRTMKLLQSVSDKRVMTRLE